MPDVYVTNISESQITMFFPMWHLVFTVPICQAFERQRHISQVCYPAEMRFFSPSLTSQRFSAHWNNYNISRALLYRFFSLNIGKAETFLVEREQSGNLSPRVAMALIYLPGTAGYGYYSYGWYCRFLCKTYAIPDSLSENPLKHGLNFWSLASGSCWMPENVQNW